MNLVAELETRWRYYEKVVREGNNPEIASVALTALLVTANQVSPEWKFDASNIIEGEGELELRGWKEGEASMFSLKGLITLAGVSEEENHGTIS